MAVASPVDISDPQLNVIITVAGNAIPDGCVMVSLNVVHEVNRISYAEVVIVDGDITTSTFPFSDGSLFTPGAVIQIKASYSNVTSVIFSGYIVKQGIRITGMGANTMVLTCKHKAATLTYNRNEAAFSTKTDSDIITSIIGTYGLSSTVTNTSITQETVFQKQATDWDFILSRAEFYGYIITLGNDDSITVAAPVTSAAAVLRIALGESIHTFNAMLSAEKQAVSLTASAWDIKNQAQLTARGKEPSVNVQGNLTAKTLSGKLSQTALTINSGTPMVQEELQAWADGNLMKMRMSVIKGDVSFMGNETVMPGDIIELAGVGERFNGNAFVTAVSHVIEDGSWVTTVKFGLDNIAVAEKSNFSYPATAGQLPAVNGLQVATVKKISADPENQFRVQVTLASSASSQDGTWARMANFYATSSAGSGFLPEIGDEVVVGFLESNPRYPIILGSLYSDAKKSPSPAPDEKNFIKSIITKSNLKMSFDDDKKIMTFVTPGANTITLSDDAKSVEIVDQNGNSIKMTSSGIEIKSGKDITLTATGNITLDATGKVSLSAKQDVAVAGMNITNTAQVGFTGKGSATAELSASGQTTVKGGIVMIN